MFFKSFFVSALLVATVGATIPPSARHIDLHAILRAIAEQPAATDLPIVVTAGPGVTQAPDEPTTTRSPHEYGPLCPACEKFFTVIRHEIEAGGNLTVDIVRHVLEDVCKQIDRRDSGIVHHFCTHISPRIIQRVYDFITSLGQEIDPLRYCRLSLLCHDKFPGDKDFNLAVDEAIVNQLLTAHNEF